MPARIEADGGQIADPGGEWSPGLLTDLDRPEHARASLRDRDEPAGGCAEAEADDVLAQAFAAPGYVTAMVNFHGSSSFGQDFTDAITGEVGRKPYIDVMNGVDHLIGKGFIDEERMAAAGGSYGGYLVSWIGTRNDRFACIINHAGVFDLVLQFGSDITHGRARNYGGTVWDGLEAVTRYSPAHHMENYVTPTLVIHGEKDYRVPVGNGLEIYGIIKAKGVPAKLIYFPDENHWVLTEKNSIFWYNEFHGWLDRWIGTGPE